MKLNIKKKIKHLLSPGEGLQQRTIRSGGWAFALRVVEQAFRLIRLGVIARILMPGDFGLLGIALLTMAALQTFSQTGFHAALIQKKENAEEYLDAAWTVSALRGLVLFAILFVAAPFAASFFDVAEATPIIRVVAISALLQGLTNVGVIYFQKELEFKKRFVLQAGGMLADLAVAVSAALILQSVWALVYGLLAGAVVRLILSYLIHPYRPRPRLDLAQARELFGFGKWVLAMAILTFLITQGDNIFVGRVLGVTLLGLYQMAYQISGMPAKEITAVISAVAFPAYSKVQDSLPSLREGYLKALQLTAFISFPLAGGIFVVAPEFTRTLLGDNWMPMVSAMQVLALWGLMASIGGTMGPLFMGVGRPDIPAKIGVLRLLVLGALIYPLSMEWGIAGTALAVVISACFTLPINYHILMKRILKSSGRHFARVALLIPFIGTGLMVLLLSLFATEDASSLQFALEVLGGAAFYFAVTYGLDRLLKYGLRDNLRAVILGGLR